MRKTDVSIIGAGQAGLAMSRVRSQRGTDHRGLERGRMAERWRCTRRDSLRLLTPNWCMRLPGCQYRGADPEGFMDMGQELRFFDDYAHSFCAAGLEQLSTERLEDLAAGPRGGLLEDPGLPCCTDFGAWRAAEAAHAEAVAARLLCLLVERTRDEPGRVAGLVLLGGYARGRKRRGDPGEIVRRQAIAALMRKGWSQDAPMFRQLFASLYLPGTPEALVARFTELQRLPISPENAWRLQNVFGDIDVSALLPGSPCRRSSCTRRATR